MAKLRNAIQNTKDQAKNLGKTADEAICNNGIEYTFQKDWFVENCAEVWAARNAILNGAKFDNLIIKSVKREGLVLFPLCENCKHTFAGHYIIE